MLIAQITDFHIGRIIETDTGPIDLMDRLKETVKHLSKLTPQPDLVVVTGDISNHGNIEDYERAKKLLDTMGLPYFVIPGNHDSRESLRRLFQSDRYLPSQDTFLHYTVEQYPLRLLMLDSLEVGAHHGMICDERLHWLNDKLSADPKRPTLIFMHHPPADLHLPYQDSMRCFNGKKLAQIIANHDQVLGVACGHTHRDSVANWAKTVLFVTPSATFSYGLEMQPVNDITPRFEPACIRLFYWSNDTGLVSHLSFVGTYPNGLTEGVPTPATN
ncbi:phosphodiesterase [uncultured Kiloniella sp.]|uniref:phosphodiesterase n=1 Tax=uncultured Kiloniella sp. TaxID=1133091 RepID=UPI002631CB20|nr:phosphodiesterase [uncultured Kiloniella sp.]